MKLPLTPFAMRRRTLFKSKCLFVFMLLVPITLIAFSFNYYYPVVILTLNTTIPTVTTTTTTIKSKENCVPYTVPDTRPFFERDFPQSNLPRRIPDKSDEDILRQLRSLRLLLLSTARNVEGHIDEFRKYTEPIVDLFHPSSRILICESDSSDQTVDKLYRWPRAQVYKYGSLLKTYPDRPERIAFCRNKLLDLSHEITADYLLMVDLDIFASNISTFISNFRYNTDEWSVMTATSNVYYDIWALRTLSDSVLNFDVWHRIWDIGRTKQKYCGNSVIDQIIAIHQKLIPIEHGLIEVRSAFNGAGLYKANLTYGCQYSGAHTICEHVPFHLCLREKNHGRIFINPEFLVD